MSEVMLGRPVVRHSPARMGKSRKIVEAMMREVHSDIPSTVERADVHGKHREKMLQAIALNKARKAGARIPRKRG